MRHGSYDVQMIISAGLYTDWDLMYITVYPEQVLLACIIQDWCAR